MTQLLRLSDGAWPRSRVDLQAAYPLTGFPADLSTMSAADLAEFDHCIPAPTPAPIPGPSERVEEVHPIYENGEWRQAWQLVPIAPVLSVPDWLQFYEAISTNPDVNTMLGHVLAAAPALYGGLIVGLSRVSNGDTQLFLAAWSGVRALMPLQAEFVASLQAVATTHNLPPDFIEALA